MEDIEGVLLAAVMKQNQKVQKLTPNLQEDLHLITVLLMMIEKPSKVLKSSTSMSTSG